MNKKNKQEEEQRYKAPRMQVFGLSVHSCIAMSLGGSTEGMPYSPISGDNDETENYTEEIGKW